MLAVFVSFQIGCSLSTNTFNYDEDYATALKQVDKFHQLYNEDRSDEIYDLCSTTIQSQKSREQFSQMLREGKSRIGRSTRYKQAKQPEVATTSTHRVVRYLLETEFEHGTYQEGFAINVNRDQALIDMYGRAESPKPPGK